MVFKKGPYINRERASELFGALVTTQVSEKFAEFLSLGSEIGCHDSFLDFFVHPIFFLVGVGNDGSPIL